MDTLIVNQLCQKYQRGVSLILALIMLAAMMLAGIALFRKIGAGAMIAGNLSFTGSAISAAEKGSEVGRTWLMAQSADYLELARVPGYLPASCYTALSQSASNIDCTDATAPHFDPNATTNAWWTTYGVCALGVDASSSDPDNCVEDAAGNKIRYVIHRLCNQPGGLAANNGTKAQQCMISTTQTTNQHTEVPEPQTTAYPLYRITTRVLGPRNTTIYTQITMF
jgi:Tfp pilus assembly protein PilX